MIGVSRSAVSWTGIGVLAAGIAVLPLAAPASAASPDLVISEVYGGGGNAGATLTNDFVELFNASTAPVSLDGVSIEYLSASGGSGGTTPLAGTVPAKTHWLVQEAKGSGGTQALPAPDATGTLTMSATSGTIRLLRDGTAADVVGYGTATVFEGSAAAGLSNTTSTARTGACTDTDVNAADFTVADPTPQNRADTSANCDGTGGGDPVGEPATVAQIQGAAHVSPLAGKPVIGVHGVVAARGNNGFWITSTEPDDNPATSEGLFVFTRTAPAAVVGDQVTVAGTVTEFRPGNDANNLSTTEITSPTVTTDASGAALPAPVLIGPGGRVAPPETVRADNPGDVEASPVFDPARNALDFYESLEGMRVELDSPRVVGPTTSFGEIEVVPAGTQGITTPSARGGVVYGSYAQPNTARVQLDDTLISGRMPAVDVGDTLTGKVVGVLDYSFANYEVLPSVAPVVTSGGLAPEVTATPSRRQVAVATFNVENLDPTDPASKFAALAGQIVTNLKAPDILAVEEVQDNDGPTAGGDTSSAITVRLLTDAIVAAGGPQYAARWIDPQDGTDGGEPGGNIRQVLLYRTDTGVSFTSIPGGSATTPTTVVGTGIRTALSASPGRIDPQNSAFTASRKPLVAQFSYRGSPIFVIAVHMNSKGGDQPLTGRFQPPARSSETQRLAQATVIRSFMTSLLTANPRAALVLAGDVNDFEFSPVATTLAGSGKTKLTDLPTTLPRSQRYTYVFEGNSQVLDHIFLSPALVGLVPGLFDRFDYDIVHTNSEFAGQISDHDPQVVRLRIR